MFCIAIVICYCNSTNPRRFSEYEITTTKDSFKDSLVSPALAVITVNSGYRVNIRDPNDLKYGPAIDSRADQVRGLCSGGPDLPFV